MTQKINAAWFIILTCVNIYYEKEVKHFVVLLIGLICWHIIFSDSEKSVNNC